MKTLTSSFVILLCMVLSSPLLTGQILVNPGFDTAFAGNVATIGDAQVGGGWYQSTRWSTDSFDVARNTGVDQGGGVFTVPYTYDANRANRQVGQQSNPHWFGQIVSDNQSTTGNQLLTFDYAMWSQDLTANNTILFEVYGSNNAAAPTFALDNDTMGAGWVPIFTGSYLTTATQYSEDLGTITQSLDFGSGYDFIGVRFRTNSVQVQATSNLNAGEYVWLDNIQIIPEPSSALLLLGATGLCLFGRRRRSGVA